MITRRQFAIGASAAMFGSGGFEQSGARADSDLFAGIAGELARIERQSRGRLGVAIVDTLTDRRVGHNADSRFPICSTFKLLLGAAILKRVDAGDEQLARRLRFEALDLVPYSPATEGRTGAPGMSVAELCEATMVLSDNTAANVLLATIGGPAAVTAFARTLGDTVTRLDRIEPELNEAVPGDSRDTTSPAVMASNLRKLVFDDVLSASSRDQLTAWLVANKTGNLRLRAGLPASWRIGDKTGSGESGTANDVAVVWPPGRAPLVITVYLTESTVPLEQRNAAIAAVGRAVSVSLAS